MACACVACLRSVLFSFLFSGAGVLHVCGVCFLHFFSLEQVTHQTSQCVYIVWMACACVACLRYVLFSFLFSGAGYMPNKSIKSSKHVKPGRPTNLSMIHRFFIY